jgi:hypothetical protein
MRLLALPQEECRDLSGVPIFEVDGKSMSVAASP